MIEVIIIVFGLILGSFANNLISYFSGKSKLDLFRSSCFCGKKSLTAVELLPLINYGILRGKCRMCRQSIPFRYPVVELLVALTAYLTYRQHNISLLFFVDFIIYLVFLIITVVDYYVYIIPNFLILSLLILSIIKFIIAPINIEFNVASAVFIILVLIIISFVTHRIVKKETIGYGDIKLIGVSFLLLDFPLQFLWLWLSALIAIPGFYLLKLFNEKFRNEKRIPFGMFLSLAFIFIQLNSATALNYLYELFKAYK